MGSMNSSRLRRPCLAALAATAAGVLCAATPGSALAAGPPRPTVQVDSLGLGALAPAEGDGLSRYVFDWGDGTQGVGSPVNPGVPGRAVHQWERPGTYSVRARVVRGGVVSDWSDPLAYRVETAAEPTRLAGPAMPALDGLKVSASSSAPGARPGDLVTGRGWCSAPQPAAQGREWLVIDLGAPRTVNRIALEPPAGGEGFPEAFSVDYCTDAGVTWYPLPIYDFDRYPNPGGATVLVETGPLVARQVRITATRLGPTPGGHAFRLQRVALLTAKEAPFFSSLGGSFDADLNDMWNIYGLACNEITPKYDAWWDGLGGVRAFGSTEWHEWDVLKLCWADLPQDTRRLRDEIRNMPLDPDGYLWACSGGRLHLNLQKHFDFNALNILAAYKFYLWTGERGFFTDPLPAEARSKCPPGVTTLLDKLRREMAYQLDALHGREGLLRITDPAYDGTPTSGGTTYWDAHPTGGTSAYPNALFYASVAAMADVERLAGSEQERQRYLALLPRIRERFNATFWEPATGRFISTVDVKGARYDYGITAANLYAVVYGVAEEEKARRMMQWLTGKRRVAGDAAQGADIYFWKIAPCTNTVPFESLRPQWWAGNFSGCSLEPGGWGRWRVNEQNGGAVFYVSYYDLLARLRTTGPDDAFSRFSEIMSEFHRGSLRPDTPGHYGPAGTPAFAVGVSVCFPESGLVPLAMLYGFLGVEVTGRGLEVHPALPAALQYAGVRDVLYHGKHYALTARRDARRMRVAQTAPDHFRVVVPNGETSLVAPVTEPKG